MNWHRIRCRRFGLPRNASILPRGHRGHTQSFRGTRIDIYFSWARPRDNFLLRFTHRSTRGAVSSFPVEHHELGVDGAKVMQDFTRALPTCSWLDQRCIRRVHMLHHIVPDSLILPSSAAEKGVVYSHPFSAQQNLHICHYNSRWATTSDQAKQELS